MSNITGFLDFPGTSNTLADCCQALWESASRHCTWPIWQSSECHSLSRRAVEPFLKYTKDLHRFTLRICTRWRTRVNLQLISADFDWGATSWSSAIIGYTRSRLEKLCFLSR